MEKLILFLGNISQASWITLIPKEQSQGFPKCPQLTDAQGAILHYPVEELSSAQTAQTGAPKPQSRHTEQLLTLGKAGPREMSSLQEIPSPTAKQRMLRTGAQGAAGAMGCPAQWAGTATDPHSLGRTLPSLQHKDTSQLVVF